MGIVSDLLRPGKSDRDGSSWIAPLSRSPRGFPPLTRAGQVAKSASDRLKSGAIYRIVRTLHKLFDGVLFSGISSGSLEDIDQLRRMKVHESACEE